MSWLEVLLHNCAPNELQTQLLREESEEGPLGVISDVFATKATSTLVLRLTSVKGFIDWFEAMTGRKVCLLPDEDTAYSYIKHLRAIKAPKTRAPKFVDTMAMVSGLCDFGTQWRPSSRILGAVMGKDHNTAKRMAPFSVRTVSLMEKFVFDGPCDDYERHVAGYTLFLIHCRARFADALHPLVEPFLDLDASGEGFIESSTRVSKNIKSKVFRNSAMPLVGIAQG
eukprot:4330686-Amphidinium_carterae.1